MGRFKDKYGITRLRALITRAKELGEKLPPEVVELAGVFSPRLSAVLKAYQALTDSKEVSPVVKEDMLELFEQTIEEMQELTERHTTDSTGDNWASKNIRPYTLFFLVKFNAFLAVGHMFGFAKDMPEAIWSHWAVAMTAGLSFYFGGRELTKIVGNLKLIKR